MKREREFDKGEIIIYRSKEGPKLEVKLEKDNIWLTQNQIALLFGVKKAAISKHIKNIINSGELKEKSTVSKMETVQVEGGRKIKRILTYFNLDMIISVGYRVGGWGGNYLMITSSLGFYCLLLFYSAQTRGLSDIYFGKM